VTITEADYLHFTLACTSWNSFSISSWDNQQQYLSHMLDTMQLEH